MTPLTRGSPWRGRSGVGAWLALGLATALLVRPASAEQPIIVVFPSQPVDDARGEFWDVVDAHGATVCVVPCEVPLPPSSDYSLRHGVRTPRGPETLERYPLPAGELQRLDGPRVTAVVAPQKGSPDGAITLGITSGAVGGLGALLFLALAIAPQGCHSACEGSGITAALIVSGVAIGVGVLGGVTAVAWGVSSSRARLQISTTPPTRASPVRVVWSPLGIAGTF